ncbi:MULTISPECIES: ABC transporter ATP-binding protein [Streptacidiphilus]|uniref:ABC transporter ATP-binding protein n=1 Tax=Streptacidiphilus cavernicola TaxID=3342716 RepID=A0ABV6UQ06_9ACTN
MADALSKRYRTTWALTDCNLSIPAGHVVGLVGPNGAGKSTLLNLAVGLTPPTSGSVEVLGRGPGSSRAQLARVGFVAQNPSLYTALSVVDHLKLGARLNRTWDAPYAQRRIDRLGVDPGRRAGGLSGGQLAQLALTMAIAKRPELLILDEPVASVDPLARRDFLTDLADAVGEADMSVILSSHLITDLERVCDYLIVLTSARVQVAGPVKELLAGHRVVAPPDDADDRRSPSVISIGELADRAAQDPAWSAPQPSLEDLVLAYLSRDPTPGGNRTVLEARQ